MEYDAAGRLQAVELPGVKDPHNGDQVTRPRYEYEYGFGGQQTWIIDAYIVNQSRCRATDSRFSRTDSGQLLQNATCGCQLSRIAPRDLWDGYARALLWKRVSELLAAAYRGRKRSMRRLGRCRRRALGVTSTLAGRVGTPVAISAHQPSLSGRTFECIHW